MRLSTLLLPLAPTPKGTLATVSGAARVLQGVALYFGTPRGARCMVPEFGYPPLHFYEGDFPGWVADAEAGLRLVGHVTGARVLARLDGDGIIRGEVLIATDSREELTYDLAIEPA